jgi:hypothetical protein
MAIAIARGRVDQVWIGDSNAAFFGADGFPPLGVGSSTERRWVWHLGPRLMYSVARDGFKPEIHRMARRLSRLPHSGEVVWIFCFGEIDIRCHLAPRVAQGDRLEFVGAYVARLQELVTDLRVPFGVCLFPQPPATRAFYHDSFPVKGSNEERLATHGVVRKRLLEEVAAASTPRIVPLDATDELADGDGWFRSELHFDGVHANDAGREAVQAALRRVLADT